VTCERVFEHLLIAWFKDVEREQRMRKKQGARQWHYWNLLGQSYCGGRHDFRAVLLKDMRLAGSAKKS
jgi:hypothetical protein